jgi:hypothetical protein
MSDPTPLDAGPELDALVEEKVFGEYPPEGFGYDKERKLWVKWWPERYTDGSFLRSHIELTWPPPRSTSIAAAWEAWDELERRGMSPGIYKRGNVYRAHADCATNLWDEAETAPLAICRAALRAVGGGDG